MVDELGAIRTFVRVAETGSFTAVAREQGTGQPAVSKQVAALEARLGTRLVHRSTKSLALSEDGRLYLEHARRILESMAEAESAVGRQRLAPAGLVRLATPVAFGRLHVAPRLARLLERYPELRVELVMSDGFVDLVEMGIDLAIRVGEITDPSLIARRVGTTRRATVAAPAYFRSRTVPAHPRDLQGHNCIVYTGLATRDVWWFESPEGPLSVKVTGNYLVNNSEAVREGVLAGIGIAVTPMWLFGQEGREGAIEIVLKAFEPRRLPIHAVWSSRRFLSTRVRAVLDFLADEFRLDPNLSDYGSDLGRA